MFIQTGNMTEIKKLPVHEFYDIIKENNNMYSKDKKADGLTDEEKDLLRMRNEDGDI